MMGWNATISLMLVPLSTFRESVHFIPHEISEQVCVDLHHQVHVLVTIYNSNPVLVTIYNSNPVLVTIYNSNSVLVTIYKSNPEQFPALTQEMPPILYIHSAFYTEKLCRNAVATFFTL